MYRVVYMHTIKRTADISMKYRLQLIRACNTECSSFVYERIIVGWLDTNCMTLKVMVQAGIDIV